jgi:ubiquinone/menaquinone biosynthesis C-methylase UbiE
MFEEGFVHINNIDYSSELTAKMKDKYKDKLPTMQYVCMDARYLSFEDNSIDAVIDKGTIDAVLCGDNSTANCIKVLSEVYRVLSPNGVFICISHRPPSHRLEYLESSLFRWEITMNQVQKPPMGEPQADDGSSVHYIYCCKKSSFSAA